MWPPLEDFLDDGRREWFVVGEDDFTDLEIHPKEGNTAFTYFYDPRERRLIKEFVLGESEQRIFRCVVTLIAKGDKFEPRLNLKKDNKTKTGYQRGQERLANDRDNVLVVSAIDLGSCHENFWELVSFLASLTEVEFPGKPVAIVPHDLRGLASLLTDADADQAREVVLTAMRGRLTEADLRLLVDRRAAIEEFRRLLAEADYRAQRIERTHARGEEPMWQAFFEEQPWIFGHGLTLVACEGFDVDKLEQYTTGYDAFTQSGNRVDSLMLTLGVIQSLMFVEIKKASTDLLDSEAYRSGVFRPSGELSGAVSQVQTAAHRAVQGLADIATRKDHDGWPLGDFGTVEPRKVVVIGQLGEFTGDGGINENLYRSFELYRRSIHGVEVITFDELLARARFILRHDEATGSDDDATTPPPLPDDESPPPPGDDDVPF